MIRNLIAVLKAALKGGPCAPRTQDQAVKTVQAKRVRRPDVVVDCGKRDPRGLESKTPTVVFEVLSPSTENLDRSAKLDEYRALATMRHVVLIAQDRPHVTLYSRAANDAWTVGAVEDLAADCD